MHDCKDSSVALEIATWMFDFSLNANYSDCHKIASFGEDKLYISKHYIKLKYIIRVMKNEIIYKVITIHIHTIVQYK